MKCVVQAEFVRFTTVIALGTALGVLADIPASVGPAAAQTAREACTHDAFRLCGDTMPDVAKTKACLAANRPSLSPLCRQAFASLGTHGRRRRHHHR